MIQLSLQYQTFLELKGIKQQKEMNNEKIISKAPGKVLIAGGYGVLQQSNYGLSLGVNSFFYCICMKSEDQKCNVHVDSPQIQQSWKYKIEGSKIVEVDSKMNIFVENAILWSLRYLNMFLPELKLKLIILFDGQFLSSKSVVSVQKSQKFPIMSKDFTKTGLGSSAAVLVSIVSSIMKFFHTQNSLQQEKRIINVISQIANLSAQNKIGSNFDISTAVFGSHLYKNVLPEKIFPFINKYDQEDYEKFIKIDPQVISVAISQLSALQGYMIDINKGENTRTMVKGFLSKLRNLQEEKQINFFKRSKDLTLRIFQNLDKKQKLKEINQQYRKFQQQYSQQTGIQIEPKTLTPMLDAIHNMDQVIYIVCPGSGGYDAVFLLGEEEIQELVQEKVGEFGVVRKLSILTKPQELEITQDEILQIDKFLA